MPANLTPLPSQPAGVFNASDGRAKWNILPFPTARFTDEPKARATSLPALPDGTKPSPAAFPETWPAPVAELPQAKNWSQPARIVSTPADKLSILPFEGDSPFTQVDAPVSKVSASDPDFTDEDLRAAFAPIFEGAFKNTVFSGGNSIDANLEPMLRATIRRALAEYAPTSRPFEPPGMIDRFIWHVQALFTSRTYEEIFFEKTRRFQVEEVFLLDAASLALVSFASCDPARHASVQRVTNTVHRLTLQLHDDQRRIRESFALPEGRHVISREGNHVVLMAIVRGRPGDMAFSDLEFVLKRIEDNFREHFKQQGSELLLPLQAYLEDCLLIQAPASAA